MNTSSCGITASTTLDQSPQASPHSTTEEKQFTHSIGKIAAREMLVGDDAVA
jgi:hypothetical protein